MSSACCKDFRLLGNPVCEPVRTFTKAPGAEKDYNLDWSKWLQSMEQIASLDVIAPPGIIVSDGTNNPAPNFSGTISTSWLEGGTIGDAYVITHRITTSGTGSPRTEERSIVVQVDYT